MSSTNQIQRPRGVAVRGRLSRTIALALGALAVVLLAGPVAAHATTTARISTSTANVYVMSGDEVNTVKLIDTGDALSVMDSSGGVAAGPGCYRPNPSVVTCPYPVMSGRYVFAGLFVNAFAGNDHITFDKYGSAGHTPLVAINGDLGADIILGSAYAETINAGGNADTVTPNGGSDTVYGQGGNDRIFVSSGERDRADCGGGLDDLVERDRLDWVETNCERVRSG